MRTCQTSRCLPCSSLYLSLSLSLSLSVLSLSMCLWECISSCISPFSFIHGFYLALRSCFCIFYIYFFCVFCGLRNCSSRAFIQFESSTRSVNECISFGIISRSAFSSLRADRTVISLDYFYFFIYLFFVAFDITSSLPIWRKVKPSVVNIVSGRIDPVTRSQITRFRRGRFSCGSVRFVAVSVYGLGFSFLVFGFDFVVFPYFALLKNFVYFCADSARSIKGTFFHLSAMNGNVCIKNNLKYGRNFLVFVIGDLS